jgi:cytochrome c-type biogenesis protein CcmH
MRRATAAAPRGRVEGERGTGRAGRGWRIAALIAVAASIVPAAASAAAAPAERTSLPVIERQVMCVTCKIPLNVAQSPQADHERAFIQSLIHQGYSEAQVKRALVGQYGPTVLGLPGTNGFALSAYLVPAAVVLALLATVILLLPRWRRRARTGSREHVDVARLDASDAARLESDLARFDSRS